MAAAKQPLASHDQGWQALIKILEMFREQGESPGKALPVERRFMLQTARERRLVMAWLRTHTEKYSEAGALSLPLKHKSPQ